MKAAPVLILVAVFGLMAQVRLFTQQPPPWSRQARPRSRAPWSML